LENHDSLIIAILKIIYDHNGRISSYTVFKKLKVPISDFMRTIFEARDKKFLLFNDDWVEITDSGRNFLIRPRKEISASHNSPKNRIPQVFLREFQLQRDLPYVPSISRLDLILRNKILRGNIPSERAE
jgi:virulence-associated protein VagC